MTAKLFVLNLNDPNAETHQRLELAEGFFFNEKPKVSADLTEIPGDAEPLILYILGHAFPDALVTPTLTPFVQSKRTISGSNGFVSEEDFAAFLKKVRGNHPTLIIWDVCFAKSFARMTGAGWADKPYVHVFSCESYEQTWHTGYPKDASGSAPQTLFSIALKEATAEGPISTWDELATRLNQKLLPLQHPSIVLPNTPYRVEPAAFGLPEPKPKPKPSIIDTVIDVVRAILDLVSDALRSRGPSSAR
jgi:hypothetical protein